MRGEGGVSYALHPKSREELGPFCFLACYHVFSSASDAILCNHLGSFDIAVYVDDGPSVAAWDNGA